MLIHSASPTITANQSTSWGFQIIPVPYTAQEFNDIMDEVLRYCMYDLPNDSFIQASLKFKTIIERNAEINKAFCRALFKNKELLEKFRQAQYDVLVSDPIFLCGELLAETLGIPFIFSLRFTMANTLERICGQLPAPPSYVPGAGMQYTDQMDFSQRLKNYLFYLSQDIVLHAFGVMVWDSFFSEMRGKKHTFLFANANSSSRRSWTIVSPKV